MSGFLAGLCVAILPLLAAGFWLGRRTAHPQNLGGLGTPVEHATLETLHTASLAAPDRVPAGTAAILARFHLPEQLRAEVKA